MHYSGQGLPSIHTPTHASKQPFTSSKHACWEILSLLLDVDFPSAGKRPVYHKSHRTKATHTHAHRGKGAGPAHTVQPASVAHSSSPANTTRERERETERETERERDRCSPRSVAHFKYERGVYSSSSMRVWQLKQGGRSKTREARERERGGAVWFCVCVCVSRCEWGCVCPLFPVAPSRGSKMELWAAFLILVFITRGPGIVTACLVSISSQNPCGFDRRTVDPDLSGWSALWERCIVLEWHLITELLPCWKNESGRERDEGRVTVLSQPLWALSGH